MLKLKAKSEKLKFMSQNTFGCSHTLSAWLNRCLSAPIQYKKILQPLQKISLAGLTGRIGLMLS
jgi:hypothetical protein